MLNFKLSNFYLILFIFLCSCTSQKTILLTNFKNNFNSFIISNNEDRVSEKNTKRFLNNGVKYINSFRDDFFEKIDKKQFQTGNLVEIINSFSENYYSAALQVEDIVYIYNGYHSIAPSGSVTKKPSKFEKINLKTFLTRNGIKPCTIGRMMNNELDDLLDDVITTRHHSTVYISRIINVDTIETHILLDICF